MERIINQKHSKETYLFTISKTFERISYYGMRSLLILYMTESVLKMKTTDAFNIYGWFLFALLFSKIIGAIIGDLFIGNKKAIILGGIIQALGAFSFFIPSTAGLYTGLFLIILGSGLYSPNLISNFGKIYLNKTKLLDAGFAIFYFGTNLGAFLAIISIGYIGEKYSWKFGFFILGLLMLLSIIPIIISKDKKQLNNIKKNADNQMIMNIIIGLITVSLFWVIYSIGNIRILDIQPIFFENIESELLKKIWTYIDLSFIIPISLIASVIWTYFYNNQFIKLTIGFIFGAIAFGILFLIPEIPTEKHMTIYFLAIFLLGISEIHIAPILFSILTKNSNPKYLAILISLSAIPIRLFNALITFTFKGKLYKNPILSLKFALISMIIVSIGLIIFIKWKKKKYLQQYI